MAGFGLALMNAASGYMRGREQRRQSEVEDQRYADQQRRQAEQDARAREMMAAQVEQMRAAQQERAAASARQAEMDQRNAYEGGYRPQADVGRMGDALHVGDSPTVGAMGGAMQSVGAMGGAMRTAAKAPSAFTLGGAPMVKSAESTTETRDNRAMAMQDARAGEARAQHLADVKASQDFQRAQQDRSFQQQRSLLGTRLADSNQPPPPKTLPMGVESEISSNLSTLNGIDQALSMMQDKGAGDAFGFMRGAQNVLGLANRLDKDHAGLRAIVGNIGSMQIKLRSGAAVTASEWPRLRGFIPSVSDSPDEIVAKLHEIKRAISDETSARSQYYQQQGYAVPGMQSGDDIRAQAVNAIKQGADSAQVVARYEKVTGKRWEP